MNGGVTTGEKESAMNDWDIEELANAVLGLADESNNGRDYDVILYEKFGITMDQFNDIVTALIPFTVPAETMLSGEKFNGFVRDGHFIIKLPCKK